jgi:murein DD-endopeptidase MepM/ murein hydrolase activator NlpD
MAIAVLLIAALVSAMPGSASARTAEEVKAELDSLKSQNEQIGREWDRAYWAYDTAEERVAATDKKLRKAQKELVAATKQLDGRAADIYRRGSVSEIDVLLGSTSFEDFVRRMDFLRRVNAADADAVASVKQLRAKLRQHKTELLRDKKESAKSLASLKVRRDRLESRLNAKAAEFKRVKAELDAIRGGPNRPAGIAGTPGANGMVFPVVGSYYYSDTWGAARSGGRHHQGTDIMAPRGTPIVAISSGSVSISNHGLGGKAIWLDGDNGWKYYFAHLDGWAVRGGHVRAGQIIGYVGNTGNAAGGVCHLHLQMYDHGSLVNPYPYLRAME